MKENNKAITLIALVVTIVVLIILAGVAISLTLGDNGIFNKAKYGKEQYQIAEAKEHIEMKITELQVKMEGKATLQDVIDYLSDDEETTYYVSLDQIASTTGETTVGDASEVYVVYKVYQFKVDKKLKTEFISIVSTNNTNDFEISIEEENGSYFTIDASDATSEGNQIATYKYYINNELKNESSQSSYTVTGVELSTQYEVKVIAIDNQGKTNTSKVKKYTTSNKQYLYKQGDVCNEITGGWTVEGVTMSDTKPLAPTMSLNEQSINVKLTSPSNIYSGILRTINDIDYSKYSTIHIEYTATMGQYGGSSVIGLNKNTSDNISGEGLITMCYSQAITTQKTEQIALENFTKNDKINIYMQAYSVGSIELNIYNMWLEK